LEQQEASLLLGAAAMPRMPASAAAVAGVILPLIARWIITFCLLSLIFSIAAPVAH
jgi:hypothetical protein